MNPEKLLAKARNNPKGLRFAELEQLAKAFGYAFDRQNGSHRVYRHPRVVPRLNIQPERDGKAKEYQVRQFLRDIDAAGLTLGEDTP